MLEYFQYPIMFAIAMGVFVSAYMWIEDSFTNKGIASKTKYIRAFIITAVGVNVFQNYVDKVSSSGMMSSGPYQQSYGVGNAPF